MVVATFSQENISVIVQLHQLIVYTSPFKSATSNSFSKHGLSHRTNKFYFLPMKVHVLGHIDVHNSIHTHPMFDPSCKLSIILTSWHRMEGRMDAVCGLEMSSPRIPVCTLAHCVSIRPRLWLEVVWHCDCICSAPFLTFHHRRDIATPDTRHQHHPSHHLPSSSLGLWYYSRHLISDIRGSGMAGKWCSSILLISLHFALSSLVW